MLRRRRTHLSSILVAAVLGLALVVARPDPSVSNAQEIDWISYFNTPTFDTISAATVNGSSIYVVGLAQAALPGQPHFGSTDAFLRVYDLAGNEQWTRQFGTSDDDIAEGVAVDPSGVYVAGSVYGPLPDGRYDAVVRKFDPAGNELWMHQFGTAGHDHATDVATDSSGVYVVGSVEGALPGYSDGGVDAFIRKYDADGNELWTRQFGDPFVNFAYGVDVDATGVYVVGGWLLPNGNDDAFIRKFDSAGNELWNRQFGGTGPTPAFDAVATASGVYVAGYTMGTLPGQTSAGDTDAWIRKYDDIGNELWTRQFGTPTVDETRALVADSAGAYVIGYTFGTFPGQTSAGNPDVFAAAFDPDGNGQWTTQFGSPAYDVGWAAALDANALYVGGDGQDAFLARLSTGLAMTVPIDVQPGSSINRIKLSSRTVITVAILSTPSFDAVTVDPGSVCFGDAESPAERDCTAGVKGAKDVDGDGRRDLTLLFGSQESGIDRGDSFACLTGSTNEGVIFEGCDSIVTPSPGSALNAAEDRRRG
jgi:hypothetical protein